MFHSPRRHPYYVILILSCPHLAFPRGSKSLFRSFSVVVVLGVMGQTRYIFMIHLFCTLVSSLAATFFVMLPSSPLFFVARFHLALSPRSRVLLQFLERDGPNSVPQIDAQRHIDAQQNQTGPHQCRDNQMQLISCRSEVHLGALPELEGVRPTKKRGCLGII